MCEELFEEAIKKRYPDYVPGQPYDFMAKEKEMYGEAFVDESDQLFMKIARIMTESFNKTERVFISNDVYHFIG